MDTSTLTPPAALPTTERTAEPTGSVASPSRRRLTAGRRGPRSGLAAEVRESLMLLGFAAAVTVGLTAAAQAALVLLS